jgi:spore coat protein U-like protein
VKKLTIISFALVLTLAMAGMSFGATAAGTLNISATVVPTCSVSTTAVNFGSNYDGTSDVLANGDVAVTCPSNTPYHIALDGGQNYLGGSPRLISDGAGHSLWYLLHQDNGFTTIWGDNDYANTYPYGSSLADTGNGVAQAHTVYGSLLAPQPTPSPGSYTDVVNVTVYY